MKIGGIRQGNHPAGLQHLDAALTAMNCSTSYVCISKKQLVCVQALADAGCVNLLYTMPKGCSGRVEQPFDCLLQVLHLYRTHIITALLPLPPLLLCSKPP